MPLGVGDLLYRSHRDVQRKIKIILIFHWAFLEETTVGVAQAQTDPKGDHTKTDI